MRLVYPEIKRSIPFTSLIVKNPDGSDKFMTKTDVPLSWLVYIGKYERKYYTYPEQKVEGLFLKGVDQNGNFYDPKPLSKKRFIEYIKNKNESGTVEGNTEVLLFKNNYYWEDLEGNIHNTSISNISYPFIKEYEYQIALEDIKPTTQRIKLNSDGKVFILDVIEESTYLYKTIKETELPVTWVLSKEVIALGLPYANRGTENFRIDNISYHGSYAKKLDDILNVAQPYQDKIPLPKSGYQYCNAEYSGIIYVCAEYPNLYWLKINKRITPIRELKMELIPYSSGGGYGYSAEDRRNGVDS
jgi:hypothetical protein